MSEQNIQTPRKALNKAYLKVKPCREQVELFKRELKNLIHSLRPDESEEFNKNHISAFLRETHYKSDYFINTKSRNDLVIHNGNRDKDSVGVLIETKRPGNKAEMPDKNHINTKAMQELVLYFLDERITAGNDELKHLVATNGYEWFVFDAHVFEKAFAQDKKLLGRYKDFRAGRLTSTGTDYFYTEIAAPCIQEHAGTLVFTWFDIREYESLIDNPRKESQLVPLLKILSPAHLLKLPFLNDSNSLDRSFYTELLYIIGLSEIKSGSKKLIERFPAGERKSGSLLENTISQLDSLGKMDKFRGKQSYGATHEERMFTVALELVLTWINRILFLKLLEGQLIAYNQTADFAFLHAGRIQNLDDLNTLFFQVLAQTPESRRDRVTARFGNIPYLNSSLFELTDMENECFAIAQLDDGETLPIHPQTVLKDRSGRRRTGELNTLVYLFEFLNAYDFSSEGAEDIQEENKTLINASVLGLIFEKINGYKDGSFYTPGFITMYMCRETIRRAVVQKFNAAWGRHWTCFADLQEDFLEEIKRAPDGREAFRKKANDVFNTIRICDPAVGSGHFLVSALNEMLTIKSELRILTDRQGKLLSGYQFEVANDELIVTDQDDQLFEYSRLDKESQRIQETLFHEKQSIIENCLFGVDINPNSVKICRLRLWIELLKNAYYRDDGQLETLPNIDINIKCGNSLLSRFPLDADVKQALRKSKWDVSSYRLAVAAYRNAQSKNVKRSMEALIQDIKGNFRSEISANDPKVVKLRKLRGELMELTMQTELFKKTAKEKSAWDKKVKDFTAQARQLEAEIEEIRNNKIFENAFEWRFEFPEVLDDSGTFVGFDIVLGNPPFIQIQNFSGNPCQIGWQEYKTYAKTGDVFCLFYERGYHLLKEGGTLTLISSNKWMRAGYGQAMRKYLLENGTLRTLIDFGDSNIFESATTYTNILIWEKTAQPRIQPVPICYDLNAVYEKETSLVDMLESAGASDCLLNEDAFVVISPEWTQLKRRVEALGKPLRDWNLSINYGIKTGCNEAFIVNGKKRAELIAEDPRSAEILKPILRGRDIKRYAVQFADLWMISTFPAQHINIMEYPAVHKHLLSFGKRLEQSGESGSRKKTSNKWFEVQDTIAYHPEFSKVKLIYAEIVYDSAFYFDTEGYAPEATSFIMTGGRVKYLAALLNSRFLTEVFKRFYAGGDLRGNTFRYKKTFLEPLPVPELDEDRRRLFEILVDCVQFARSQAMTQEAEQIEAVIDGLVYDLYFAQEMRTANCFITERIQTVLQPFNQNDSDGFKNEYIQTLCTFFRNDKTIRHALVHRRNVHPVNLIVGATS